jgi:hypothetical protein
LASVRTWKPIAGGILSIVAGGIHFIGWLGVGLFLSSVYGLSGDLGLGVPNISHAIVWIITLPFVILAIVAIVGGVFALQRRIWGLALAGGICAILSPLTFYLGIVATIFIALSKNEFNHHLYIEPPTDVSE